jgi:DNA-binding CsgD family transcriptional regulator
MTLATTFKPQSDPQNRPQSDCSSDSSSDPSRNASNSPDVAFHTRQLAVSLLIDPRNVSRVRQLVELGGCGFDPADFSLNHMLLASVLVDVYLELGEHDAAAELVQHILTVSNARNGGALVTARVSAALVFASARTRPTRAALGQLMELTSRLEVQAIDNAGDLLERARSALLIGRSWALANRFDVAAVWLASGSMLFRRCGQSDWARTLHDEVSSLDSRLLCSESSGTRPGIGATTTDVEPVPRYLPVDLSMERPQIHVLGNWSVGLTPAEHRVALLIGGGRSNREAAAQLFVSIKTVESHVQSVFRKLGLHRRSELAHLIGRTALA